MRLGARKEFSNYCLDLPLVISEGPTIVVSYRYVDDCPCPIRENSEDIPITREEVKRRRKAHDIFMALKSVYDSEQNFEVFNAEKKLNIGKIRNVLMVLERQGLLRRRDGYPVTFYIPASAEEER